MKQLIDLNQYFDQIYCINLKSRPDRLAEFKKNFNALGTDKITFIEAIDGKTIDIGNWKYSRGALGCRLSHIAVYNDAIKNKFSKILVFEDDTIINKYFRRSLHNILSTLHNDWDLIYFGGNHCVIPEKINDSVIKLKGTTTTHSIAINCRCLPEILSTLDKDDRYIDTVLADLQLELNVYGPSKPIAYQKQGYSDIEETNVNYNMSFTRKIGYQAKKLLEHFFMHK